MIVRKKPITVNAWKLNHMAMQMIPEWVLKAIADKDLFYDQNTEYWGCNTLEGQMMAHDGDYLMLGIKDELYFCAADVFNDTYDIIKEDI